MRTPDQRSDERGREISRLEGLILVLVGTLSVVAAWLLVGPQFARPGWMYAMLGPLCWYNGRRVSKRVVALEAEVAEG